MKDQPFTPNALAMLALYNLYISYFKNPEIASIPDNNAFFQSIHNKIKEQTFLSLEEISEYIKIGYYISQYISMSSMSISEIEKHNSIFFNSSNTQEKFIDSEQDFD